MCIKSEGFTWYLSKINLMVPMRSISNEKATADVLFLIWKFGHYVI